VAIKKITIEVVKDKKIGSRTNIEFFTENPSDTVTISEALELLAEAIQITVSSSKRNEKP